MVCCHYCHRSTIKDDIQLFPIEHEFSITYACELCKLEIELGEREK